MLLHDTAMPNFVGMVQLLSSPRYLQLSITIKLTVHRLLTVCDVIIQA